jgi:hypothetical protein
MAIESLSRPERFRHARDDGIVGFLGGGRIGHRKSFAHLATVGQQMPLVKDIGASRPRNDEPMVAVGLVSDDRTGCEILERKHLNFGESRIERVRRIDSEFRTVSALESSAVIGVGRRLGLELIRIVDRGAVSVVVIGQPIVGLRGSRRYRCRHDGAKHSHYKQKTSLHFFTFWR